MATIGLKDLYYAPIIEGAGGYETYGIPQKLAKAIQANISVELAEAILYADDGASESVKEFKQGTLSLGIDDLGSSNAAALLGATVDSNGVLISKSEDSSNPVAIAFRARKANGEYRFFWLYKVVFGIPGANHQTKGDSITFQTPTIEGTVMSRIRPDSTGKHPWKAEVTTGENSVTLTSAVITSWFSAVYEPNGTQSADTSLASLSCTNCSLDTSFIPTKLNYTGSTGSASGVITFVPADSNATAKCFVNGAVTKDSGGTVTYGTGDTVVTVTVFNGAANRTYTIVINKPST